MDRSGFHFFNILAKNVFSCAISDMKGKSCPDSLNFENASLREIKGHSLTRAPIQ